MARLPRIYIEGILYYVTARSGINQNVFVDPADYKEYIGLIDKYKKQYGFKLFSYVLLPTHLHMLIELKNNIGISNIMHDINSLYTKMFNSRYNKKGHLFQERFKATFAEKETHLLGLTRHIHLNPQRAKLIYDPKDYPYSSHCQYVNPEKRDYPDIRSEVEEAFKQLKAREGVFDEYVKNATPAQENEIKKILKTGRILGGESFKEQIKKAIEEKAKQQKKLLTQKKSQLLYIVLGGAAILVMSITIVYFSRQHKALETEYSKTLVLYEKTLDMLKREKDNALKANEDIERYQWKIRLTEQALQELRQEKTDLEGYTWGIKLTQIKGPSLAFSNTDTLIFRNNHVSMINLRQQGFPETSYSQIALENGKIVWETIQTSPHGETASLRGEWDGRSMRGILRRRSQDGTIRDFSFTDTGARLKRGE